MNQYILSFYFSLRCDESKQVEQCSYLSSGVSIAIADYFIPQTWVNLQKPEWKAVEYGSDVGQPAAREHAALALIGRNLYMFGGFASDYLNELWVLSESFSGASPSKPVWQQLSPTGAVPTKRLTQMVAVGTRLYIFGGVVCLIKKGCFSTLVCLQ
jgi:N-acetylneuraminic acid mutarotase